ncbi:DUF1801 domain-containing protein [Flavimaricola marinus]|uniref:YdhG-like domain-containing protein n=1 Tax=Flavimaricola marinus TaxID=1819565 RepID=A0A238LHC2_9RHOB|nr:DUF1801 domain-containing protein [Flavimaricola marinus]SMY08804.1 hypothetical protein LOM8899_02962 [Flavimaricola marinus]
MTEAKTKPTSADVAAFIAAVEPKRRHDDALVLDEMFRRITGWAPRMWGPTIIGYGQYAYTYDSGHSGTAPATGFSPRKASLSLYIMPGYDDMGDMLDRLGKHKIGKSCLYINKLDDVDPAVLEEIIRAGLDRLGRNWPIEPS